QRLPSARSCPPLSSRSSVPPRRSTKRPRTRRVLVAGKLPGRLRARREVGEALHPVVDEHAVEVVELVLEDAGLESPRLDEDILSPDGKTGNNDLGGPPDAGGETGLGKASLPAGLGAGGQDDLGVDQQDGPVGVGGSW